MRDIAASYHDAEPRQRVRQVDDMVFAPAASSGMPRSGSFRGRGMPANLIPGKEGEEASSRTSRGGDHERPLSHGWCRDLDLIG